MPKHERVLSLFPSFYDATQPLSLLYQVAQRLSEPLEIADTLLYRIQRAHRLQVVEDLGDLLRLAAALNLDTTHFADLLAEATPDPAEDGNAGLRRRLIEAYAARLRAARGRVQRIAQVHLDGLGTPWALLEGAAIFLNATIVGDSRERGVVHHEDEAGYSHWVDVAFRRTAGEPLGRIVVHENPLRRRPPEIAERYPVHSWGVRAASVEPTLSRIVIEGIGDRAVLPCVYCAATGEGIAFNGVIPDGKTLVVDAVRGATLDGEPADAFVSYDVGGRFDVGGQFDPPAGAIGRYIVEHDGPRARFDGDLAAAAGLRRRRGPHPAVPVGESPWVLTVAIGVYDESDADYAVFAIPLEPIGIADEPPGFDATVFDFEASARVGIGWDERIPCAVKLLVPPRVPVPSLPDEIVGNAAQRVPADAGRMSAMMERFRPAGVKVFVDLGRDEWILGRSVVRAPGAADGAGIEFDATAVHVPGSDRFLPLDPATLNA